MRKRISTLLIAVLALAAFGGTASLATAKQGADDPAGHVRHSGADDPAGHVRHNAADDAKKARAARRAHHRRGADDGIRHARHGHGADDAPNHG
jgi:hypothetical protein